MGEVRKIVDAENEREFQRAEQEVAEIRALKPYLHQLLIAVHQIIGDGHDGAHAARALLLLAAAMLSTHAQDFRDEAYQTFCRIDGERNWESLTRAIPWPPQ